MNAARFLDYSRMIVCQRKAFHYSLTLYWVLKMANAIQKQEFDWMNGILVIWCDKIYSSIEKDPFTRTLRRNMYQEIEVCDDPTKCEIYIIHSNDRKIFLITSLEDGQDFIPNIHNLPQLESIYIYNKRA